MSSAKRASTAKYRMRTADKRAVAPRTRKTLVKKPSRRASSDAVGIIVRRGALKRFDTLKKKTADLPVVVTWDRRLQERRVSAQPSANDQRRNDRRQKPPFTWDVADFIVVDPDAEASVEMPDRRRRDTAEGLTGCKREKRRATR
jgi:hypothetical protein